MKKVTIVFLVFVSFLVSSNESSAQAFDDGTNVVMIGFGLPPSRRVIDEFDTYKKFYDYKLRNYGTGVLKYEHGLHKYFGLGLNFEYSANRVTYKYGDAIDPTDYKYNVDIKNKIIGGI